MAAPVVGRPAPPAATARRGGQGAAGRAGGGGAGRAGLVAGAAVALARADAGLIGAAAPALRHDLHLGAGALGLLASLATVTGALSALPAGRLVDGRSRRAVLAGALVVWSIALGVAGLAAGLLVLAAGRLVSGAASSAARPSAVSVLADRHPAARRGRVLARLDAAESGGAALSYLAVAGALAVAGWRAAFLGLAGAGLALAWAARALPGPRPDPTAARRLAVSDALRVRTNVVVLVADCVGNLFFAAVTAFAVLAVTERFRLPAAEVDALAPAFVVAVVGGLLLGGRLADRVAARGRLSRRLVVACVADVAGAAVLLPAFLTGSPLVCAALLALGVAVLSVGGPCRDAVRVDVIPSALRGRAEAARGLLTLASGVAGPLVFAALAATLGGAGGRGAGLDHAFLVMLMPLAGGGLVLLAGRRSYGRDAAGNGRELTEGVPTGLGAVGLAAPEGSQAPLRLRGGRIGPEGRSREHGRLVDAVRELERLAQRRRYAGELRCADGSRGGGGRRGRRWDESRRRRWRQRRPFRYGRRRGLLWRGDGGRRRHWHRWG